jgi:hypothetical protein
MDHLFGRIVGLVGSASLLFVITPAGAQHRKPDFNGDGFADLAIGSPLEDVGAKVDAGAVNVLYGSATKLNGTGDQFWTQDSTGILDAAEANENFGSALAWGDFDGDGRSDLAIGVPNQTVNGMMSAGAVNVLYGTSAGLSASGDQFWTQDNVGVTPTALANDHFGLALTVGDFNGDGFDDLAIGVPNATVNNHFAAGAVNILYGTASGLRTNGAQFWSKNSSGILGTSANDESFGWSLAAGDFDNDGRDDLAIGVPLQTVSAMADAGSVSVIYGTANGLRASGNQVWNQDSPNIRDSAQAGDQFGWALTTGDFDHDGFDDLVVGVPFEDISIATDAGAINVIYGSATGLVATGNQFWTEDTTNILDQAELGDRFGIVLASGDFDHDGKDDLVVGVPFEPRSHSANVGAVHILYGTSTGLSANRNQFWNQDNTMNDVVEQNDMFGATVVVGDFNGDGRADLAIGVPGEDFGVLTNAGAEEVLYGSSVGLRSTSSQIWTQDTASILDVAEDGDFFSYDIRLD